MLDREDPSEGETPPCVPVSRQPGRNFFATCSLFLVCPGAASLPFETPDPRLPLLRPEWYPSFNCPMCPWVSYLYGALYVHT